MGQNQVEEFLRKNGWSTIKKISESTGMTIPTLRQNIKAMKRWGLIESRYVSDNPNIPNCVNVATFKEYRIKEICDVVTSITNT